MLLSRARCKALSSLQQGHNTCHRTSDQVHRFHAQSLSWIRLEHSVVCQKKTHFHWERNVWGIVGANCCFFFFFFKSWKVEQRIPYVHPLGFLVWSNFSTGSDLASEISSPHPPPGGRKLKYRIGGNYSRDRRVIWERYGHWPCRKAGCLNSSMDGSNPSLCLESFVLVAQSSTKARHRMQKRHLLVCKPVCDSAMPGFAQ